MIYIYTDIVWARSHVFNLTAFNRDVVTRTIAINKSDDLPRTGAGAFVTICSLQCNIIIYSGCVRTLLCYSFQVTLGPFLCHYNSMPCHNHSILCHHYIILCHHYSILCHHYSILCHHYSILCHHYSISYGGKIWRGETLTNDHKFAKFKPFKFYFSDTSTYGG